MSDDLRLYVVGLGANLGDRRQSLRSAVVALAGAGELVRLSDLYETAPIGPPQPDYLNAAALLRSGLAPGALLTALLEVEQQHGRERRAFALVPLLDVLPDARDARSGVSYQEHLSRLDRDAVRRVETRASWAPHAAVRVTAGRTE